MQTRSYYKSPTPQPYSLTRIIRLLAPLFPAMLFVFAGCFLFSSGRGVHPSEKLDERGAEMFDQAGKHIRMGRFTEAESMLMRIAGEYPAFFRARPCGRAGSGADQRRERAHSNDLDPPGQACG